jgi:hypothetical protein
LKMAEQEKKTTNVFLFRMISYHLWLKLQVFTNKKGSFINKNFQF